MWHASDPAWREWKISQLPIGRIGTVEEIASAYLCLASDEAAFMIGQSLSPTAATSCGNRLRQAGMTRQKALFIGEATIEISGEAGALKLGFAGDVLNTAYEAPPSDRRLAGRVLHGDWLRHPLEGHAGLHQAERY
jgi:hypothetical protein